VSKLTQLGHEALAAAPHTGVNTADYGGEQSHYVVGQQGSAPLLE